MILAVLALASVLLVVADPWRAPVAKGPANLWEETDPTTLRGVRLTSQAVQYEAIAEKDGWHCLAPRSGIADPAEVRRMLGSLRLLRSIRSAQRSVDHALGRTANVALTFPSGERTLAVGALTADGRSQWVAIDSEPLAHLVEAHLLTEFLTSVKALRNVHLVPWSVTASEALRIESENRWLQWQGQTMTWLDDDGAKREIRIDPDTALAWRDAFAKLVEAEGDCATPPAMRISQGENVAVLSDAQCVAPTPLATLLAGWRDPWSLASMQLLPTARPTGDFTIRCQGTERDIAIAEVDQRALWAWWSALNQAPRGLIEKVSTTPLCTIRGGAWSVAIGRAGEQLVASAPHPGQLFVLDEEVQRRLQALATLFTSTSLVQEDAVFLQRLEIADGSQTRRWERGGQPGAWLENGTDCPANLALLVTALSRTVATLEATEFIVEAGLRGTGAKKSRIHAWFDKALGEGQTRYEMTLWGGPGRCTVVVEPGAEALLDPRDCAVLWNSQLH